MAWHWINHASFSCILWMVYVLATRQSFSNYDVPEIFSSGAFSELLSGRFPVTVVNNEVGLLPFVSFFSGHVANIVIVANHMYINGFQRMGLIFHVLNCLQVYRLLATRGHYSIDIIVGFVVAVHVTNPQKGFGLYFSYRGKTRNKEMMENFSSNTESLLTYRTICSHSAQIKPDSETTTGNLPKI